VQELVDRATRQTGLSEFGGDSWRNGLDKLVGSALTEARFNAWGEESFYGGIVRTLANRLQIEDWFAKHPEINDESVHVELIGVGFPRTGSTALAAMLGEDPSYRFLRVWEAGEPCPPPGVSNEADSARIKAGEEMIVLQQQSLPRFSAMLPQSATGPMECHQLMELEFTSQMQLAFARLPSYADWFLQCDMEPTYRYQKRVMQLLQWRCPPTRWQLKCPTHTLFLDDIAKVFPEARFVMTHREVGKVLPSVADLYSTLLAVGSSELDPYEVGRLNLEQWGVALDRMLAFRTDERQAKFFDIGFQAFQADPLGEIGRLYDWLGRDLTSETQERMRAWRTANPRDKHGTHSYNGEDFGLTEAVLDERFRAYRQRFGDLL
jgi:hypothetical protein